MIYDVLIVDDQPSICKEVSAFLKDGYRVRAFKSGTEAITYLSKNHVDLIILDYYMPEMTGFEVMLKIRQNQNLVNVPVIFLTSESSDRLKYEMTGRGAVDYLTKPVNADNLRATVARLLIK